MRATVQIGGEELPQAIPAVELETMLGSSSEFCSWDPLNSTTNDLNTRWPFLFSHPLMGTNPKISAQ
jgi:hypothetical protein